MKRTRNENDAEDITIETFSKAFEKIGTFDEKFKFKIIDIKYLKCLKGVDLDEFKTPQEAYSAAFDYILTKLI